MRLEDDHHCFACGSLNNSGLKLKFHLDKEKKSIFTEFTPKKIHQGFKDIVHGGILGLILDECMVNLAWRLGMHAVSAEYTIKLINPAATGKKLTFSAQIISENTRMLAVSGKCVDEEGINIASSSSKCIKIKRQAGFQGPDRL
ncbi:PaaI family thioesterase [Candidatus Omnitrophota bacterium]